jgi:hypothetical protein
MSETVEDFDDVSKLGQGFSSVDKLEELDLGGGEVPRPTYVNARLTSEEKAKLHEVLREYVSCFAWSYIEMLGLSKDLVEHTLSTKPGFRLFKQPVRSFNTELLSKIKEEVERLLQANFIRTSQYTNWVSNIVPVEKEEHGKDKSLCGFPKSE